MGFLLGGSWSKLGEPDIVASRILLRSIGNNVGSDTIGIPERPYDTNAKLIVNLETLLVRFPAQLIGGLLVCLTLLPLIPTGQWFVRGWDFPRLQISCLIVLPLLACIWLAFRPGGTWLYLGWVAVLSLSLCWQISHVLPLSPLYSPEVATAPSAATATKLMVVNLDFQNSQYAEVAKQIKDEAPDVLLLIEINDSWSEGLASLRKDFPYHHEEVREDGLGIALWTKQELLQVETREIVSERRPSIWADIKLASGRQTGFVGVHPTPPGLKDETGEERRDSRVRDAELLLIAEEIKQHSHRNWVVSGDFNDVAWSHTTRLFKRTSGLKDPRVGRSFMGTYHAKYAFLRFPIDHVFLSDGFQIQSLERRMIAGSDHFAVIATIVDTPRSGVTPEQEGNDEEDVEEIVEEGEEDAEERGVDGT
jgi:endonuclease/exonuclease/phosphatase (EEP) superfamily protein YafD